MSPLTLIIAPFYASALAMANRRNFQYLQWLWIATWDLAVEWIQRIARFGLSVVAIQVVEA